MRNGSRLPIVNDGVERSSDNRPAGRGQEFGIPNTSPQQVSTGPSGPTFWCALVKPNTPSTTNVGERIVVADHDPLATVEFCCRPMLIGLYCAPPGSGKMPVGCSTFGM